MLALREICINGGKITIKTFQEAKAYLEGLIPYGKGQAEIYGLERIRALAEEMGNPQNSYPIIHIGGTAGKGSTATMAAAILQESGYKTGLHVSPHLEDIRERAQVNGKTMTAQEFVDLTNAVKDSIEKVQIRGYTIPTYFETLVAMTLQHFKNEMVDVAVIEVGLGGTVDGTNIVKSKVAVLTNVGLDHVEKLGNTIEEIAADKVGIFKEGTDVVSGVTQPSVIEIVENQANKMNCRLNLIGREIKYDIKKHEPNKTVFCLDISGVVYDRLEMHVLGDHQVSNALLAIAAVRALEKYGLGVKGSDIRNALKKVSIPGRFEIIENKPTVIIDGAHNPMKTNALYETFKTNYPSKRVRFVFAAKKGKDIAEMLKILSPIASKFYFTKFQATTDFGNKMSSAPEEMTALTKVESEVVKHSIKAFEKAKSETRPEEIICITGSLYLAGELRSEILKGKNLQHYIIASALNYISE